MPYPLRGDYVKKTEEATYENNITVYDALYISLAMIKRTRIYTADMKLNEKLKDEYSSYVT